MSDPSTARVRRPVRDATDPCTSSRAGTLRLPGAFLDLGDDRSLGFGVGVHIRPVLIYQRALGALVQVAILRFRAQVVAKTQEIQCLLVPDFVDVHVDIAGKGAHHAASGLADAEFVASVQELVEVVLFGRDVVNGDEDVEDRLHCQSRH